jgi:hypothetical protein
MTVRGAHPYENVVVVVYLLCSAIKHIGAVWNHRFFAFYKRCTICRM